MKKIILCLTTLFTLLGVIKVIQEENQIERVYILDK